MKHTFLIENEQEEKIKALLVALVAITGGTAEVVKQLLVITEDEMITKTLETLLNQNGGTTRQTGHGSAVKDWTIVDTGEKISYGALDKRIQAGTIEEGVNLFHEIRGNFVVERKDNGKLTLKRVLA